MSRAAAVQALRRTLEQSGPARLARLDDILAKRAASPVMVLENAADPHNAAACLRSAEGFGLQYAHLVERHGTARVSGSVATDADRWLTISRFPKPQACVDDLRKRGCTIIASDLSPDAAPLGDVLDDLARQNISNVAFVLGNEHGGISPYMRAAADRRFILPMYGFVQSYNMSASAAMVRARAGCDRSNPT